MSRRAARDVYARALRGGEKTVDLAVEFIDGRDGSLLWSVGGVWHRKLKKWLPGEPSSALRVEIHVGQLEAAVWFGEWFRAYLTGDTMSLAIYSVLLLGGSRAGKTWLGLRVMVAFAIAVPGARIWAVQEADPDRVEEMSTELDEFLPPEWFRKAGNTYRCVNGTTIRVRSGQHPAKLKRGRCDFAFLNEGQNVKEASHNMLRMRTSDTSGLVVTAANPPNDNPDGEWVADFAEACKAGRRQHARTFHFDPNKNPRINREQLAEIANETDPRTYAIEVLGQVLPPSNAVYHSFSQIDNIGTTLGRFDCTEEFALRRGLGKGITHFVGQDYQCSPHMAAVVAKAFRNPDDPDRPLLYYVGAIIVDLGDEYDLSAGMYDWKLDPRTTAIVGDASGEWQGGKRVEGQTSFKILKECGWRKVYQPDKKMEKNPRIIDRMKNDNRLFHSQSGSRIVRIDPDGAPELIEAVKKWRKKKGQPNRRSRWAHVCDAMSYLNWRLYPRTLQGRGVGYKRIKGRERAEQMRGY